MTGSERILNKEPEELGRFLLEAARQDSAPEAARERALLSVTSVALGMGVASSAAAYGSPASLVKASGWLVAKWLVAGLGSGVLTIAVAQGVQQLATNHAQSAPAARSSALKEATRVAPAGAVRERPLLEPQPELPVASPTAVASAAQSVPALPVASGSGAASLPQASTGPAVPALPSAGAAISPLTRELALLEQARGALARHAAPRALQALDDYRAQFPSGSLQAEAAALRVEAVGQSGDRALAERLGASFLATYPTSPLSAARSRVVGCVSEQYARAVIDPHRNDHYSSGRHASDVTGDGRGMLTNYWILSVMALNAVACAPTVFVGDLGGSSAGSSSGGASQGTAGDSVAGGVGFGGAAGGAGEVLGVAGDSSAACADTLNQALPPIQATCPVALPNSGASCEDQVENSICFWQVQPPDNPVGYRALGCYSGLNGKIWSGVDVSLSGNVSPGVDSEVRPLDAECPQQAPTLGESCPNGMNTETCLYPTSYCECGTILPGQWLCDQGMGGKVSAPRPVQRLCTSTYFDETQLVKDMGPKLTPLWCQWSAQLDGTEVPVSGRDSPGVANTYLYRQFVTPEMSLCLADLPPALCAQNLDNLGSKCTATIGELDDCVETIYAQPSGWVGHGCAPLFRNPTCAGVLVQPFAIDSTPAPCVVPLE